MSEHIRNLVARCYNVTGVDMGLEPNALDGQNPASANLGTGASSSGPVQGGGNGAADGDGADQQTPADIIQQLVGRCYAPTPISNEPNPLDGLFRNGPDSPAGGGGDDDDGDGPSGPGDDGVGSPDGTLGNYPQPTPGRGDFDPPPDTTPRSPAEVIQGLVGRCYPDLPNLEFPTPEVTDTFPDPSTIEIGVDPIICFLTDELGIEIPGLECGGKPVLKVPDPTIPEGPWISTPGDDCAEILRRKAKGQGDTLKKVKKGKYLIRGSKPKQYLYCREKDGDDDTNKKWEKCVRDTLKCTFTPYIGGGWQPRKASCEGYYPRGWSANKTQVCVDNCFPERVAIYESVSGSEYNYHPGNPPSGYTLTNSDPAWYLLKEKIYGFDGGKGINVEIVWDNEEFSFRSTNRSGVWNGNYTRSVAGKNYWPAGGVSANSGTDVLGDEYTVTLRRKNCEVDVSITPIYFADGQQNDVDSNWAITAWRGELPTAGTTITHTFSPSSGGKPAKEDITFSVIVTGPTQTDKTTGLFKYKGNNPHDYFLTTNPGAPDTQGAGERSTMDSAGMVFHSMLGFCFQRKGDGISYLGDQERMWALHRFYNPSTGDHRYTIDAWFGVPERISRSRFGYRIPKSISVDLVVRLDVEKGSAGYDNSFGYYLASPDGPQWGKIVVPSAKSAQDSLEGGNEYATITVPAAKLALYAGGTMGFFLLPDGKGRNSGLSQNQEVSFNSHSSGYGPGFRGNGIDTNENDYALFSDREWNPEDQKDFTKWKGANRQMWEDLIDGDDDYDDLHLWHQVEWSTFPGYIYEGVQCWVYNQERPTPINININLEQQCEQRDFNTSFADVMMTRQGCGSSSPVVYGEYDPNIDCSKCSGSISHSQGRNQKITCKTPGKYRIKSYGGTTGGSSGEGIRWKMTFKKNGVELISRRWTGAHWPAIGADIYDQEFTLERGDKLQFKLDNIISGPPTGQVTPYIGIFNVDKGEFSFNFGVTLNTLAGDDALADISALSTLNSSGAGVMMGLDMQFYPMAGVGQSKGESKPRAGSNVADAWHQDARDNKKSLGPKQATTEVIANSATVNMHGLLQQNPSVVGGNNRNRHNPLLPDIAGGYIDTGYLEDDSASYRNAGNKGFGVQKFGADYREFLTSHLITRFETVGGTLPQAEEFKKYSPVLFAKRERPWYMVGDLESIAASVYDGGNNFFSPNTFVHDYYLDNNAESDNITDAATAIQLAKVRVAFTFYSTKGVPDDKDDPEGGNKYAPRWFCAISVMSVLQYGTGYSKGQEFDLQWPPERLRGNARRENYSPAEDASVSPFFPDQVQDEHDLPKKLRAFYEESSVKRVAKESFYQESHNKNSPVWYTSSVLTKHRVNFKLIINQIA